MPDLDQATLKPFVTHEVASRNLVLVSLFDFSYSVFTDGIIWTSLCQIWIKALWDLFRHSSSRSTSILFGSLAHFNVPMLLRRAAKREATERGFYDDGLTIKKL